MYFIPVKFPLANNTFPTSHASTALCDNRVQLKENLQQSRMVADGFNSDITLQSKLLYKCRPSTSPIFSSGQLQALLVSFEREPIFPQSEMWSEMQEPTLRNKRSPSSSHSENRTCLYVTNSAWKRSRDLGGVPLGVGPFTWLGNISGWIQRKRGKL